MRVVSEGILVYEKGELVVAAWAFKRDGEPDSEWPPSPQVALGCILDHLAKRMGAKMPSPEPVEPSSEAAILSWEAIQKANRG